MTAGGSYQRKRIAQRGFNRVQKRLAPELQPGEELESAFFAHRYVPGLFVLLFFGAIGDAAYVLVARPYYLALTNQRFFLLKGTRFGFVSRPKAPEFTTPADQVRIDAGRRFLLRVVATVRAFPDKEVRLAVHRQYWGELEHMRATLDRQASG